MEVYFVLNKVDGDMRWEARYEPEDEDYYYCGEGSTVEEESIELISKLAEEIKACKTSHNLLPSHPTYIQYGTQPVWHVVENQVVPNVSYSALFSQPSDDAIFMLSTDEPLAVDETAEEETVEQESPFPEGL